MTSTAGLPPPPHFARALTTVCFSDTPAWYTMGSCLWKTEFGNIFSTQSCSQLNGK